jgi:hypothetical protein
MKDLNDVKSIIMRKVLVNIGKKRHILFGIEKNLILLL